MKSTVYLTIILSIILYSCNNSKSNKIETCFGVQDTIDYSLSFPEILERPIGQNKHGYRLIKMAENDKKGATMIYLFFVQYHYSDGITGILARKTIPTYYLQPAMHLERKFAFNTITVHCDREMSNSIKKELERVLENKTLEATLDYNKVWKGKELWILENCKGQILTFYEDEKDAIALENLFESYIGEPIDRSF